MSDHFSWEIYKNDMVGIVPLGYVYASTYRIGNIHLKNNYGHGVAEADVFMATPNL